MKLSKEKLSCYKPSFLWPFYFVTALAQSVLSHASCTKSKLKPVNVGAGTWQVRPQQLSILTVPLLLPAPDRMEDIIFDACFMSSVEALYDLRSVAPYIVAAPAAVMSGGFPYSTMVPLLLLLFEIEIKVWVKALKALQLVGIYRCGVGVDLLYDVGKRLQTVGLYERHGGR